MGWNQHPRNGKIARLPGSIRQRINQMLDDGLPYRAIIQKLRDQPLPYAISEMNLSNWYHGGYQDYLRQSEAEVIRNLTGLTKPLPPPLHSNKPFSR
jgi:hypothetical protein